MASYFIAFDAPACGTVAVHDRSRCPPGCFLQETGGTEYLGEFLEPSQAIAVARLRYAGARCCSCAEAAQAPGRASCSTAQPLSPS